MDTKNCSHAETMATGYCPTCETHVGLATAILSVANARDRMREENNELRAENSDLREENMSLRIGVRHLRGQVTEIRECYRLHVIHRHPTAFGGRYICGECGYGWYEDEEEQHGYLCRAEVKE